ncbi:MAG: hypothetical protein L0Z48_01140, partial [candidate division Zixibacteria bacterium]|nr:hypothetical protein [candidate division Zixibacteria bacterium]
MAVYVPTRVSDSATTNQTSVDSMGLINKRCSSKRVDLVTAKKFPLPRCPAGPKESWALPKISSP